MKLWFDDVRPAPEGWVWARTIETAIRLLLEFPCEECSLDHDLGYDYISETELNANPDLILARGQAEETGLDLVEWMLVEDIVPPKVTIHSWNPDGAKRMKIALREAGFEAEICPFRP